MRKFSISAIIPTFNRKALVDRALRSVLEQSHRLDEVIVVDDGSTDLTYDFLIKNYPQVTLIKTKNKGVSAARNIAIQHSQSEWLAFLDSDDEWLPEKIQKQLQYIKANPAVKIIHTEENWIRNNKPVNMPTKYKKTCGDIFKKSVQLTSIGPSTVMINRHILEEFDESYPVCEDYELWLRLSHKHDVALIDEPLINKYAGHEDQLSHQAQLDYWRLKAIVKNYSLFSDQQKVVAFENAVKRISILKKGYSKYNNIIKFNEVSQLEEQLNDLYIGIETEIIRN